MTDSMPTLTAVEPEVDVAPTKRRRRSRAEMGADAIYKLIGEELQAQHEKWGEQNHPLVGGIFPNGSRNYYAVEEDRWKRINDQRVADKVLGWDGILIEETFEALAAPNVDEAIAELVQVAAVAVQAILSIRRNGRGGAA